MPISKISSHLTIDPSFGDRPLTAQKRLLVAIFERALRDYYASNQGITSYDRQTARTYFSKHNRPHQYGTFSHFCQEFNFDFHEMLEIINSDRVRALVTSLKSGFTLNRVQ